MISYLMLRSKPKLAPSVISFDRGQDHVHHGITLHKHPKDHLQPDYQASPEPDPGDNPQARSLFTTPGTKQNPSLPNVNIKLNPMDS